LCAAIEKAAVVFIFTALVFLLFFNIVSRSVFQTSFQRVLEFVPTLVLWLALIGSSLALREARHIKIELLLRFCPPRLQTLLRRIVGVFGMVVMGILCAASLEFLQNEIGMFGPAGWRSIIMPIFFGTAFFRFLLRALDGAQPNRPESSPPFSGGRQP
jgi:TRAP-type C4-dicarboxylate transport system permease small subunit